MRINGDIAGWHKQPAGMGAQSERECRGGNKLIAERQRHLVSEGLGRDDNTGIAGGSIEAVCVDLIPSGVSCSAVRRRVDRGRWPGVHCAPRTVSVCML